MQYNSYISYRSWALFSIYLMAALGDTPLTHCLFHLWRRYMCDEILLPRIWRYIRLSCSNRSVAVLSFLSHRRDTQTRADTLYPHPSASILASLPGHVLMVYRLSMPRNTHCCPRYILLSLYNSQILNTGFVVNVYIPHILIQMRKSLFVKISR